MTYLFIYFRTTEQANPYFVLQQRRSQEERRSSLASFFVTTIGSVLDNKVNIRARFECFDFHGNIE
jgi:hypothetical protein